MLASSPLLRFTVATMFVARADFYIGKSRTLWGEKMAQLKFSVSVHVSSDNPSAVKPVLEQLIADKGTIRQTDQGFEVEAELEGESARNLNRMILSALRRAEKRTRIRAEWTSGDTVEKFFDYGSKGTRKAQGSATGKTSRFES